MRKFHLASRAVLPLVLAACFTAAHAQTFPTKPIKLIVPLGAGGATDAVARVLATKLSERLGQSVVVENKPGAEGVIGVDAGAKSPADGYTLVLGSSTTLAANFYLRKSLPFHPLNDLAPVAMAVKNSFNTFIINPSVPANNLQEFIALAKAKPGTLNYGTGTSGSKICVEMLKNLTKTNITMVNYKSSAASITDLIGGQVQLVCEPVATSLPHIQSGKVRSIGVTSPQRLPSAPNLPTVAESGLPGFEYSAWVGVFAPVGTPAAAIKKISDELAVVLKDPDSVQKIQATGFDPMIGGPAELSALLKKEMEKAQVVVQAAGLKPE